MLAHVRGHDVAVRQTGGASRHDDHAASSDSVEVAFDEIDHCAFCGWTELVVDLSDQVATWECQACHRRWRMGLSGVYLAPPRGLGDASEAANS